MSDESLLPEILGFAEWADKAKGGEYWYAHKVNKTIEFKTIGALYTFWKQEIFNK